MRLALAALVLARFAALLPNVVNAPLISVR